ncbi:MAG: putative peptidoglycan glycosyltransferase FtsW [Rickettsiaceae bacterium]|nr:putative peptidoglycan glycosyltransferase FtsW [Rickettsiaceae bacterium]
MNEPEANFLKILFWKWWRGVDRQFLIAIGILIFFSLLLVTTASSAVAARIGVADDFFSSRHLFYMLASFLSLILVSTLNTSSVKKLGIAIFAANFILLIMVKFYGFEIKGARRWINILGFSIQPSEFIKPGFAIVTAIIFSHFGNRNISFILSAALYGVTAFLMIIQPDLGMVMTLTGIWGVQIFVAGLPLIWMICAVLMIAIGLVLAYKLLPHVTARIDSFFDPQSHENYQVSQSLKAFHSGGLFGKGPGEGVVKNHIPDSHADFIFSVAGEEFGIVICMFISLVFAFIVLRSILSLMRKNNEFVILASSGIIGQLALQSVINMGVALNLLPTKGMTLPFISYGGSSTIAIGIGVGMLLALSKNEVQMIKYNILEKNE